MERTDLYQDDLTEERLPTPADRATNSDTMNMDNESDEDDDEDLEDEDEEEEE